jgi:polyhydroxybutyrate depolymerase
MPDGAGMAGRLIRLALVCTLVAGGGAAGCGDGSGGTAAPSASVSASPSAERPGPGDHSLTIDVGGVSRSYLLHAPPGYAPGTALPLVIALHFYPGTGAQLRDMIGMDAKADTHNALVAYPDGVAGAFNALICCGTVDDVAFLSALTKHLTQTWNADPQRVYLTGISNGGDMSFRAAVEAGGLFAAIGVVSGGYSGPRTEPTTFVPTSPVSVVTIVGRQDRFFPTFQAGVTTWQQRLNCTPVSPAPPTPAAGVIRTGTRCADGSDVDVYVVDNMGHVWPGATGGPLAGRDAPLNATDIVWDFFAAHPKRRP